MKSYTLGIHVLMRSLSDTKSMVKQVKFTVERRGSREDTTALPAESPSFIPVVAIVYFTVGLSKKFLKMLYALEERKEGRPAYALGKVGKRA